MTAEKNPGEFDPSALTEDTPPDDSETASGRIDDEADPDDEVEDPDDGEADEDEDLGD